ncbi:hypothetical protein O181_010495 [Austropuccinia psidii MF-1]|uniref:Uncharacterized protein n=1 Tax=Austropuccinia psidii MF-1 TaxID=1389203 RepID=A0A9Q3BTB6_9BASI|nr:hypothetical protein [Austropuccinia psidii MF-1]
MEHRQQEVQPRFTLGRTGSMLPECMSERDTLQNSYGNPERMKAQQRAQTTGGRAAMQRKNEATIQPIEEKLNHKEDTLIPAGTQGVDQPNPPEKKRFKGQEQGFFQPQAERVTPNDTGAVGLGERSTKQQEVIRSPATRNNTPQMELSVATPESNINSNELWEEMSQFAEKTQERFAKLKENNERLEELTASQNKIVKSLQQGYAKLRKASEETNKSLNQVIEG